MDQSSWHLVFTKPKQEFCAYENLGRQGYECYLPTLPAEKLRQGLLRVVSEPLFPRYLFIRLGQGNSAKSWMPIRSTKGVSRLVSFGAEPVRVDDGLIEALRTQEAFAQAEPKCLFKRGERVRLTQAPFAGIEGVYQMTNGELRAIVLIEILCKPLAVCIAPAGLRKVS